MQKIPKKRLENIVRRFDRLNMLVVGDLMLDRFVWGNVSRISPEAPVPVVEVTSESDMPGGGANVAKNIRTLGSRVHVCGIIGDDYIGGILLKKLTNKKISLDGVIVDRQRTTTLKTRIIAHIQQVVRVDKESKTEINKRRISQILSYSASIIEELDAIIIEDYGKGMITQPLVSGLIDLATRHRKILAVDPKMGHAVGYRGANVITPNRAEAFWMAGIPVSDHCGIDRVGTQLLKDLSCEGVLITLGENGMCLFQKGRKPSVIPTTAREVYDVSGAGDTVISTFTASLAAGGSMREAAIIANYAAGVVVGKVGTGTANRAEIIEAAYR